MLSLEQRIKDLRACIRYALIPPKLEHRRLTELNKELQELEEEWKAKGSLSRGR